MTPKYLAVDTKILKRKTKIWAGILLAQIVLFYFFSKIPGIIKLESLFFEAQKLLHQKLFSIFPFSMGDVFYLFLSFVLIYLLCLIIRKKTRAAASLKLVLLLNILYFTYQIFWGLLYFQKPLSEKLPQADTSVAKAKILAEDYLQRCIELRKLVEEDSHGVFWFNDLNAVKNAVLQGQNNLPNQLSEKIPTHIISIKPSLFAGVMSYTGILGYYNPFTSEAQYNPQLPATYLPFTIAHETAHQLGFAREQEANFMGFLTGNSSENINLRYSTSYFALKSLLRYIATEDPDFVKKTLQKYSPGMLRDRAYEHAFLIKHEGWADRLFLTTNDLFLQSNQQEGSITYSYFVYLLLRYESRVK